MFKKCGDLFTRRQLECANNKKPSTRRGLAELSEWIDFENFRPLLNRLIAYSSGAGHPHYDVILMFKVLIIQTFYGLSDDETEFQIADRMSFLRFCSIGANDKVPDAKTIWAFRERLGKDGVDELFEQFHKYMADAGLRCSGGTIVDASFIEAPIQRNSREENQHIKDTSEHVDSWSEAKKKQKDVDAKWTKKDSKSFFGYKHHAAVDVETKVINAAQVTSANVADHQSYEELIGEETVIILADSAYVCEAQRKQFKKQGITLLHPYKRKRGEELTNAQKQYNKLISSKRCRVEHVFGIIKHMKGDIVRCVGIKRCHIKAMLVSLVYNMRRYGYLCRIGELCPRF